MFMKYTILDDLPDAEALAPIFEQIAVTYPVHILERRITALTPNEKKRVDKKWSAIATILEEIDHIIAMRAEINHDPWE